MLRHVAGLCHLLLFWNGPCLMAQAVQGCSGFPAVQNSISRLDARWRVDAKSGGCVAHQMARRVLCGFWPLLTAMASSTLQLRPMVSVIAMFQTLTFNPSPTKRDKGAKPQRFCPLEALRRGSKPQTSHQP